ncbi:MAG TPA: Lsr2 family protein [Frankiaceae bacterium]|nr:Lsr2 family protein [Frankiaceae bacterium]
MASRTLIELLDDLDGSEAAATVSFSLDGQEYEIDLSEENASRLREAFNEWTPYARKVGGRAGTRSSAVPRPRRSPEGDSSTVRQWAEQQGYQVSARGRIATAIRDAYHAARG